MTAKTFTEDFWNSYGFGFIKKYEYTKKLKYLIFVTRKKVPCEIAKFLISNQSFSASCNYLTCLLLQAESPLTYSIVLVANC